MIGQGNRSGYDQLVNQILTDTTDARVAAALFVALQRCISTLTLRAANFGELFDAIFKFNWTRDPHVCAAFGEFITYLVSSNSIYLIPALRLLVNNLLPSDSITGNFVRYA
jgi:hypothetical protein